MLHVLWVLLQSKKVWKKLPSQMDADYPHYLFTVGIKNIRQLNKSNTYKCMQYILTTVLSARVDFDVWHHFMTFVFDGTSSCGTVVWNFISTTRRTWSAWTALYIYHKEDMVCMDGSLYLPQGGHGLHGRLFISTTRRTWSARTALYIYHKEDMVCTDGSLYLPQLEDMVCMDGSFRD